MKKIFTAGFAATMALSMVGCSSADDSATSQAEETETVITVGISPDYAPYESLDTDGNIIGFDPDMVAWFETYLNDKGEDTYSLEFKQMNFDNIVTQLQGDQIDLGISGFSYSEDRKVEWSDPYIKTAQVAVVPNGSDITSVDQLEGAVLAAQTGSTGEAAANEIEGAQVSSIQSVQDIFAGLGANQYDAAVVDLGVAKEYVDSGNFTMIDGTLADEENYVIAKEGNTKMIDLVNDCIAAFVASDDYTALCDEYDLLPLE